MSSECDDIILIVGLLRAATLAVGPEHEQTPKRLMKLNANSKFTLMTETNDVEY